MMASLRAVLDDFLHECLQFCDTLDSSTKSLTTLASKRFNAHDGTLVTGVFHALHVFFFIFFFFISSHKQFMFPTMEYVVNVML